MCNFNELWYSVHNEREIVVWRQMSNLSVLPWQERFTFNEMIMMIALVLHEHAKLNLC